MPDHLVYALFRIPAHLIAFRRSTDSWKPGRLSLERGEYYANPQNAFRKILALLIYCFVDHSKGRSCFSFEAMAFFPSKRLCSAGSDADSDALRGGSKVAAHSTVRL